MAYTVLMCNYSLTHSRSALRELLKRLSFILFCRQFLTVRLQVGSFLT